MTDDVNAEMDKIKRLLGPENWRVRLDAGIDTLLGFLASLKRREATELAYYVREVQADNRALEALSQERAEKDVTIENLASDVVTLEQELAKLREALSEIAKGEGRFNSDPLKHASNTIEDMKGIANAALGTKGE